MGQALVQAQQERELTKRQLAGNLARLETRVRAELDWRARLRHDGARYAVIGAAAVATLLALVALRAKLRRGEDVPPALAIASLNDVAAEIEALRKELRQGSRRNSAGPLWQKVVLRAVTAAGAAAGTMAARSLTDRLNHSSGDEPEPFA